jgi:hypothetical protein
MRRLLLVVALVGCTHATSSSPAWPKERATSGDGGESIAPRESAKSVAVAIESSDDDAKPAETPVDKPADKPAPVTEGGAPAAAAAAATEDVITTEEIVIEVGPDD